MSEIVIAAPGPLDTRTGGYRYDARVLAELTARRHIGVYLPLPTDFPLASAASIERALSLLSGVSPDVMLVVDGLAFGALPVEGIMALNRPVTSLVHHPLALETGLSVEAAGRLESSERAALGVAAFVIVTSATTREILVERYRLEPARIRVAEPGVDPVKRAKGSGGAEPVILTVGSITPRKNQITLARALARIADLPWRWRVAGSLVRDLAYADVLRTEIARAGIDSRVELLGELDDAALAAAFDGADLFALPSRLEGYGMVHAEALARALPVVAGRGEATRALVPETAGALVDPDDEAALAGALRALLSDPNALKRAGRYARSAGARLPRWFQCADVFEHLMGKVLSRDLPA